MSCHGRSCTRRFSPALAVMIRRARDAADRRDGLLGPEFSARARPGAGAAGARAGRFRRRRWPARTWRCASGWRRFFCCRFVARQLAATHVAANGGRRSGWPFSPAWGLYLQTLGLAWTDASIAAFLTQLYTLIVPLIVAVRDRRLPSRRVIVACVLVLVGRGDAEPGSAAAFHARPGRAGDHAQHLFHRGADRVGRAADLRGEPRRCS